MYYNITACLVNNLQVKVTRSSRAACYRSTRGLATSFTLQTESQPTLYWGSWLANFNDCVVSKLCNWKE